MNLSDIISVDPAKKTLGALHPDTACRILRRSRIYNNIAKPAKKKTLDFLFASLAPGVDKFGGYMLLFRSLFAAMLIVSGSFIIVGEIEAQESLIPDFDFAVAEIISGTLIALGLLTRFASFATTMMFGALSIVSILSGIFNLQAMMSLFGSLVFLIFGAGKFSCDFLLRKAIINKASAKRRKIENERLSYKAFRNRIEEL